MLLTGEPGIGKTRLAEEAVAVARARGARIVWATAWEGDGAPPLWPWVQILRQLAGTAQALEDFTPESAGASAAAQFAQFSAVAELIRRTTSKERLLAVIEDLQWADTASITLLTFVAAATRDVSCLLVGTCRPDELGRNVVNDLRRVGTSVAVPPLPPEAAAELLRAAAGPDVGPVAIEAVVERSGGNPLFVWEFGQLMAQAGRVDVAPAAVPDAVAAVIERRLARLSEDVVAVLRIAAVAGKSVDADVVASIGALSIESVRVALETAAAVGILVRADRDCFTFSHDLVRELVLSALDRVRREGMHERAAVVFTDRARADPSFHATVADHLEQAGPDHSAAAAVEWALAARRAQAVLAHREASAMFGRAARASTDARRRAELILDEGHALLLAGDLEAARDRFTAADNLARDVTAPDISARAVLGIGVGPVAWEVPIGSGEHAALVGEALAALPEGAIELRSMLLARLSVTGATPETMPLARERAAAALELAEQLDDGQLIAQALAAVNDAHAGPAYTMLRRDNADAIVELAGAAADRMLQLLGFRFRIVADLEIGDLANVDRSIAAFTGLAEELRQPLVSWYVPLFRGIRALLSGNLVAAEHHQREVAAAAEVTGSHNAEMMAATLLLGIQAACGQRPNPNAFADLFHVDPVDWASYASGLAMVAWLSGDTERARHLLKLHADNRFARLGDDGEHLTTLVLFGRVAVGVDERSAVATIYDRLLAHAGLWAVDGIAGCCWGPVDLELARLALAMGRIGEARSHLSAARRGIERAGAAILMRDATDIETRCAPLETAPAERPAPAIIEAKSVFRRDGQFWTLAFKGRTVRMKDAKGLHDIARLLARPGHEVHVLNLIGFDSPNAGSDRDESDLGELLDARARAEYRRRIAELDDEIGDAERNHDRSRLERARSEREFIAAELSAAIGIGGRPRRAGDPSERARKAITGRVRLSIGRIRSEHVELGRHLANAVKTGTFCVYEPEQLVEWELTAPDHASPHPK